MPSFEKTLKLPLTALVRLNETPMVYNGFNLCDQASAYGSVPLYPAIPTKSMSNSNIMARSSCASSITNTAVPFVYNTTVLYITPAAIFGNKNTAVGDQLAELEYNCKFYEALATHQEWCIDWTECTITGDTEKRVTDIELNDPTAAADATTRGLGMDLLNRGNKGYFYIEEMMETVDNALALGPTAPEPDSFGVVRDSFALNSQWTYYKRDGQVWDATSPGTTPKFYLDTLNVWQSHSYETSFESDYVDQIIHNRSKCYPSKYFGLSKTATVRKYGVPLRKTAQIWDGMPLQMISDNGAADNTLVANAVSTFYVNNGQISSVPRYEKQWFRTQPTMTDTLGLPAQSIITEPEDVFDLKLTESYYSADTEGLVSRYPTYFSVGVPVCGLTMKMDRLEYDVLRATLGTAQVPTLWQMPLVEFKMRISVRSPIYPFCWGVIPKKAIAPTTFKIKDHKLKQVNPGDPDEVFDQFEATPFFKPKDPRKRVADGKKKIPDPEDEDDEDYMLADYQDEGMEEEPPTPRAVLSFPAGGGAAAAASARRQRVVRPPIRVSVGKPPTPSC